MKFSDALFWIMGSLAGGFVLLNFLMFVAQRFLYVCAPNEILIFSGREHVDEAGAKRGFRVVTEGRAWRVPFLERVERMDLTTIPIELTVRNAYSNGGIALNVQAIGNVKISSDRKNRLNAIERLLGRSQLEIQQVARETLEGGLRGIVATLTPEQVNEDRLKFVEQVREDAADDLAKLGLQLDTLKIQAVSDEVKYLDSIGRSKIAEVLKRSEIAESDARNEANKRAAAAQAKADVARSEAEESIVAKRNELGALDAELRARVRAAELTAKAAADEARSLAEKELQDIRKDVERIRLKADVVLPAEADRVAKEALAKGDAAPIQAQGEAVAESLEMLARAWSAAGDDASEIFLLNQVEQLTQVAADAMGQIEIGETRLIDAGDGKSLASLAASFPEAMAAILGSLRASTGVDIPAILSRRVADSGAAGKNPAGGNA